MASAVPACTGDRVLHRDDVARIGAGRSGRDRARARGGSDQGHHCHRLAQRAADQGSRVGLRLRQDACRHAAFGVDRLEGAARAVRNHPDLRSGVADPRHVHQLVLRHRRRARHSRRSRRRLLPWYASAGQPGQLRDPDRGGRPHRHCARPRERDLRSVEDRRLYQFRAQDRARRRRHLCQRRQRRSSARPRPVGPQSPQGQRDRAGQDRQSRVRLQPLWRGRGLGQLLPICQDKERAVFVRVRYGYHLQPAHRVRLHLSEI